MALITVRGHEFNELMIKDSYDRRAIQFKNNIIAVLQKIGLTENDIDIVLPRIARLRIARLRNVKRTVTMNGRKDRRPNSPR